MSNDFKKLPGKTSVTSRIAAVYDFIHNEKCTQFVFVGQSGINKSKRLVISCDTLPMALNLSLMMDQAKDKMFEGGEITEVEPKKIKIEHN